MSAKLKTIKLSYPHMNPGGSPVKPDYLYRVEQITDSIEFEPKALLSKQQVDSLCASREWKVTIVASSFA